MFSQTNETIIHSMHDTRTAYGITLFPASYGRRPEVGDGSMRRLAQSTAPKVFCRIHPTSFVGKMLPLAMKIA